MVLEILCVEPINPQYSRVLETCLALRYLFFEVLGSESVKKTMPSGNVQSCNNDVLGVNILDDF